MIVKICKNCGFSAPEEWFTKSCYKYSGFVHKTRRTLCPMCIQEQKDSQKRANRAVVKARNMIYSHARKYGMKPVEFAQKFGWSIIQMVHDIQHNFENWCPYCQHPYKEMGHGLSDLTLDIINPHQPPYYANVRYCCGTCNRSKGQRGVEDFGFHLAMVRQRQEFLKSQCGTAIKPQYRLHLVFEGG